MAKRTKQPARRAQRPSKPEPAPVDERVRRSKQVVLRTASDLLVENGMSGVSVDEVSRRSGVAKTTIYRHWRTRADLVLDACATISTAQATPNSGSFESDMTLLLSDLANSLRTARWPLVLPSIVDAAERDPDLAAMYSEKQLNHATPYLVAIERGKKKGQVPAKADAAAMVAQLIGPLFYRRWFSREPLDEKFVKSVVKSVLAKS